MDVEPVLIGLVITVLSGWLGSIEMKIRALDVRLRESPSRKEVSSEIEVRQAPVKALQKEIKADLKEDIKEIKACLRKIEERLNN